MALSALDDKSREPSPAELRRVSGRSGARWEELIAHLEVAYAPLTVSWGFAAVKMAN